SETFPLVLAIPGLTVTAGWIASGAIAALVGAAAYVAAAPTRPPPMNPPVPNNSPRRETCRVGCLSALSCLSVTGYRFLLFSDRRHGGLRRRSFLGRPRIPWR